MKKWAGIIVRLLIVADIITGLLFNLHSPFYRIGLFVKAISIFLLLIFYLTKIKRPSIRSVYILLAISIVCWIISSTLSLLMNPIYSYGDSLTVLNRYLLFFVLVCLFIDNDIPETYRRIIETFFTVNNIMIILGFIFTIKLLSSYNIADDNRFGYKGLIYGANEVAGIYIIGLGYFYRECFKHRRPNAFLLFLTCFSAALTGTKATLIALILLTAYYFIRYRFTYFITLLIPAVFGLGYLLVRNWNFINEKYLASNSTRFLNSNSIIGFLMSGRKEYIDANFDFISKHWTIANYIFGDAFLYSETDILDLFFFFGFMSFLYLYAYTKFFFIRDRSRDNVYVFLVLISIASLGGHIIQSAVVPVFVLLYIFSEKRNQLNEPIRNNSLN